MSVNENQDKYPIPVFDNQGNLKEMLWFTELELGVSGQAVSALIKAFKREKDFFESKKTEKPKPNPLPPEVQQALKKIPFKILRDEPRGYKVQITEEGDTGGLGQEGYVVCAFDDNGLESVLVATPNGVWQKLLENVKVIEENCQK